MGPSEAPVVLCKDMATGNHAAGLVVTARYRRTIVNHFISSHALMLQVLPRCCIMVEHKVERLNANATRSSVFLLDYSLN